MGDEEPLRSEVESRLLNERELVAPEILQQFEYGFRTGLESLIDRTTDPRLRSTFERMRECPVTDAQGRCRAFTDYIVGAFARHGLHRTHDLDDALVSGSA